MEKKFKALGHEVRLRIYRALREEKLCVCEIHELVEMSQPAVSQHLSTLRNAGLVETERRGQWTFYNASDNSFREAVDDLFENTSDDFLETIDQIKRKNLCGLRDSSGNLAREGESSP